MSGCGLVLFKAAGRLHRTGSRKSARSSGGSGLSFGGYASASASSEGIRLSHQPQRGRSRRAISDALLNVHVRPEPRSRINVLTMPSHRRNDTMTSPQVHGPQNTPSQATESAASQGDTATGTVEAAGSPAMLSASPAGGVTTVLPAVGSAEQGLPIRSRRHWSSAWAGSRKRQVRRLVARPRLPRTSRLGGRTRVCWPGLRSWELFWWRCRRHRLVKTLCGRTTWRLTRGRRMEDGGRTVGFTQPDRRYRVSAVG